mmetsp:Transcript_28225/g.43075  ORF Transcript_28225/g.43075 Transcript_28225/m.43075 type:complete len:518 (+) Transcript_28225:64-1617(+)
MTSLPADPSIQLGNIIDTETVDNLMTIAQLQKPTDLANERLNSLLLSTYKLKMIFNQMVNLKVPGKTLEKLGNEIKEIKKESALAAVDLAEAIIQTERDVRDAKLEMAQQKISIKCESPINWATSTITPQPISYDSLVFDVQYFSSLETKGTATASSGSGTSTSTKTSNDPIKKKVSWWIYSWERTVGQQEKTTSHSDSYNHTSSSTSSETDTVGVIVIVAKCTHKNADVFAPCILDARKSVAAWNYYHPDDRVGTDPAAIMKLALSQDEGKKDKKVINLLSGASRSSSFVGYANILKTDSSKTDTESESLASAASERIKKDMFVSNMQGQTSSNNQSSSSRNDAFSSATLETSCSLSCMGCIPSIVANEQMTAIKGLDPDPSVITNQMASIAEATGAGIKNASDMNAGAGEAANAQKFMTLDSNHLKTSVQMLGEESSLKNKVIDMETMMTAFEDYVKKAQEGNCGIPTSYFIKQLDKAEIAKIYARQFYPNGAATAKDAMAGQLGTAEGGKTTDA